MVRSHLPLIQDLTQFLEMGRMFACWALLMSVSMLLSPYTQTG